MALQDLGLQATGSGRWALGAGPPARTWWLPVFGAAYSNRPCPPPGFLGHSRAIDFPNSWTSSRLSSDCGLQAADSHRSWP